MNLRGDTIYLNRRREQRGPLIWRGDKNPVFPWKVDTGDGKKILTWTEFGLFHADGRESEEDLIDEVVPEEKKSKPIYEMTLADYRRGINKVYGWG